MTLFKTVVGYILFSIAMTVLDINPGIEQLISGYILAILAILLLTNTAQTIINSNKLFVNVGIQALTTTFIATVLFLLGASIRDASPFPFMAQGVIIAFCLNLLILAIYKLAKLHAKKVVIGLLIISFGIFSIYSLPRSMNTSKMKQLETNMEHQYAYRYKDDIYFNSNRYDGIYKLNKSEIVKIQESPKITNYSDINLWIDKDMLYYRNEEKWYSMNLDTSEVTEQAGFKVNFSQYFDKRYDFVGISKYEKNVGYINYCKINNDGYIYFSTDNGLYRAKPDSDVPEHLLDGHITMFDISDDTITYYDFNKTPNVIETKLP